jgi:hypothetical protein
MAKAEKKKEERTKRGKYDNKIAVKGSFIEIMTAAAQHADKKSAPKKKA